jgi:zinc protease
MIDDMENGMIHRFLQPTTRARAVSAAAFFALGACATAPQPATPPRPEQTTPEQARPERAMPARAAPDRSVRPTVGEAPDVTLPPLQEFTLANGLRVVLMEKRDLPLVQLNLIVNAGSTRDNNARPGLASITAAMLDEGAAGRTALEIADAFESIGARFNVSAGRHNTGMTLRAPTHQFGDALGIAADVLLRPDFPADELDRLRLDRLTTLVRRHDEPDGVASVLFDRTMFGDQHPYGRSAFGTAASLRAIGVEELHAFHAQFYRPNNAAAIFVGDIDLPTARRLLEDAFGGWQPGAVPPERVADAPQVQGRTVYIVDMPGAAQSVVRLGRIGAPRTTRDYYALNVMNVILGGSFTSRLNQNLREDKGYTYGASSWFEFLPAAGPWTAGAAVQTHSTGPALAEFFRELEGMHESIPPDEVDRARNFLAMRFPAGFQSVAGTASHLGEVVQYGLPADYFDNYVDNILAVTNEDVERVAREYLDARNVAVIIVGDRAAIEQQVRAENPGTIRFLEVTDVLGPVPVVSGS